MSKHTPGPWSVERICLTCGFGGSIVANEEDDWKDRMICPRVPSPANARLIAAAPDLLAASKVLIELAQSLIPVPVPSDWDEFSVAVVHVWGAIERAEKGEL